MRLWIDGRLKIKTGDAVRDRNLLLDVIGMSLCIIAAASMIAASLNPQNALFIGFSCFILLSSCAAVYKYLATFHFGRFCRCALIFAATLLGGLLVIVESIGSERQAEITLVAMLYPTLLLFVTTLLIWRAQYWESTRTVVVLLCLSMVLMLLLIVVLTVIKSVTLGLMFLALWSLLFVSVLLSLMWTRFASSASRLGPLLAGVACIAVLALLVGGLVAGAGMLAFSAVCWIAIGSLLVFVSSNGPGVYAMRTGVLPVWSYDAERGCAREANSAVYALMTALLVLLAWASFADFTGLLPGDSPAIQ